MAMNRTGRRSTNRHRFQKRRLAELMRLDRDVLETHYGHVLESPGKEKRMLGVIFRKAQNMAIACF
jgi:hypothetical protein